MVGNRGPQTNVLLIAVKAATNQMMRPAKRREVQLRALDHLWSLYRPPVGSWKENFDAALLEVATYAHLALSIPLELVADWARLFTFDRDIGAR